MLNRRYLFSGAFASGAWALLTTMVDPSLFGPFITCAIVLGVMAVAVE